ncbi:oxidoreductase [Lithospermum erythrorhizon]|uniref:4-hydroxy-tetrahydrodipicolinate reductase n=1 Tax=Lithospermum erythrorhizon TaxID=34254 RepID=A0AAV3PRC1_LITER
MAFAVKVPISSYSCVTQRSDSTHHLFVEMPKRISTNYFSESLGLMKKKSGKSSLVMAASTSVALSDSVVVAKPKINVPIMVNGSTGKMGRAVLEAAINAGLQTVPVSFGGPDDEGKMIEVGGREIKVHGPSDRENVLFAALKDYPDLIVVDYTIPAAVNGNAELYSKVGVPFVMGTTGGDRELLYKNVTDSKIYAVISPQMGKQVVAFLAAMEIMSEQFPGAFSGYNLQVSESHQASKLDASGTAKAVISCFQKLGVSFEMDEIKLIRDPREQVEVIGVPEQYLAGHAFHMYHLTSPDNTVCFEFQHNVCGRSIYAEGTVDAVLFLAKKIQEKADKKIYDMIDVLREGNMR